MSKRKDVSESNFKVGDVLVGTTGYNRTITKWYKITKVTKSKVTVDELPVSYPTQYGSNTPGDICMPVIDGQVDPKCPFYFGDYGLDKDVSCFVYDSPYQEFVKTPGDYGIRLRQWDGAPGWVNCD